ncbi:MAG: DUF4301 family protein [Paludibacteraceae bacterium]|nr:DUF4301 family protein [Paludibacteraceae bacterium]
MAVFNDKDIAQLSEHGISLEMAEKQMDCFRNGFPQLDIVAPASTSNGILVLTKDEQEMCLQMWQEYVKEGHEIEKFVPASGAATRMFKDLFAYIDSGVETEPVSLFLSNKEKFAFGPALDGKEGAEAVRGLLYDMHYGSLPKGLLLFHSYRDGARTAAQEQLAEAALTGACKVHFTVSPEHLPFFRHHIADSLPYFEKKYGVRFDVSFSCQHPDTDTLAANPDATPFRTEDGRLLFRPGGHGALISNLNEQQADVVFIKNIDNVVPDRLKKDTVRWKQILGGVLVAEQQRVFARLQAPELSEEERALLMRPIRVCGVVKNTGEPGGGPFMVRDADGRIFGQILESGQIADPQLMKRSTHFNPVDLVCAFRMPDGKNYNLLDFVDPDTGFISHKSSNGKELLALELPGLWNGAMSKWNTLFVQVPGSTFNPVKTVNDLLRIEHQ